MSICISLHNSSFSPRHLPLRAPEISSQGFFSREEISCICWRISITDKLVMDLQNNETLCRAYEVSLKCLQSNKFSYKLQSRGNSVKAVPELKHDAGVNPDAVLSACTPCNESPNQSKEFYNKPIIQHDFGGWPIFYPEAYKMQQFQMNAFGSQCFPVAPERQFQYALYNVCPHGYPYGFQFQEFEYFVVIDFEATCDKENNPIPQEIIEFPSVIVSSVTGRLEACFQTYVRPTCNQLLSDFCKDLTGIQQIQVDRGVALNEALIRHDKWLEKKGIKSTSFAVVTWSNWDCKVMLESECRFKNIRKPQYFDRWINLKVPFYEVYGSRCNLKEAVEMAGLSWQGRAHCGLDDAKNTARLLALLMHRGFKFSITNWLTCYPAEVSLGYRHPDGIPLAYDSQKQKDLRNPFIRYGPLCFCGVKSGRGTVRKPGPKQGSIFFGCGNWTTTRGAHCHFFEWASD